jgi:para-nitrobenzyl esterase
MTKQSKRVAPALAAVLAAASLAFVAPSASRAASIETPTEKVATTGGTLVGAVLPSKVQAWLGIPFAAAPVGDLRWKAPQPTSWKGTYSADRRMPECIQVLRPHDINHYFGEEATSEDCLYMNVWAPPGAKAGDNLPVVVFLYGGGSTIGSSGMASYGGETMAKRGAVFVNFNYRVGILGFMAHPELSKEQGGHSGNYAYLDQNAGLKWINANIAKFGGDPSKVVVTGQSAGAGSVVQQIFSPLSKGLFRGAMMSSGCNWGGTGTPLAEGEKTGMEIQKRLKAADLAAMRNVPADRILAIQNETQVGVSVQGVRVGGIIDGYFMPKTQMEILKAHEINDVPIIASFNHDESASPFSAAKTVAEYRAAADKLYGKDAAAFLKLYPVAKDSDVAAQAGRVARASGLERNARNCAVLQSQYAKSKAYIDTYSRKHPYVPGVKIADQDTATIGAYHTADIPYWFGTQDAFNMFRPTRNWTAWDRELSERMSAMLIAFANTGDPSTAKDKWPAWAANKEVKLEFNDTVAVTPLDVKGIAFLTAHAPAPGTPAMAEAAGLLGNRIGNGPRD